MANSPFQKILENYRKYSFSEHGIGNKFERLMRLHLLADPKYANEFDKVWLWNHFDFRKEAVGNIAGIDIVTLNLKELISF